VRNIDWVAGEQSGIGAPLDSVDEDPSHRRRHREFLGAGVEILEGSREHDPGQRRVVEAEPAEHRDEPLNVGDRVVGLGIRNPSKNTARTNPDLSWNNSYTAGTEVLACSATRRMVKAERPSSFKVATATFST